MKYTKDKTEILRVRLSPEGLAKLDSFAAIEGVTRSEALRRIVAQIPVIGYIQDGKIIKREA